MPIRRGRNEGCYRQEPDGAWRVWFTAGVDENGKRVRITKRFPTKKQCQDWFKEQQAERDWGRGPDAYKVTAGQWLDRWLELRKGTVERNTWKKYEGNVRRHLKPFIGAVPLRKLDKLHVRTLFSKLIEANVSRRQQHKAATVLRMALKEAVESNLIRHNVATLVKKPKLTPAEMVCWEEAEAGRFLAAVAGQRWEPYFVTALDSGARPGELFALHWPDVDWQAGTVFIRRSVTIDEKDGSDARRTRLKEPKTARGRRKVQLSTATLAVLKRHRDAMKSEGRDVQDGPVFIGERGAMGSLQNLRERIFVPAMKKAGVRIARLYDLRHTSATILLGRGVNIRVIADRLGHETPEFTLRHYLHAMPSQQKKAAESINDFFSKLQSGTIAARTVMDNCLDYQI